MSAADAIKVGLQQLIEDATSHIDYLAAYPSTVMAQSGQEVDLQPDSDRVPAMSGVPLQLGIPGLEVTVAPGSRVLLCWADGDPRRPIATAWEKGGLLTLTIDHATLLNLGGTTRGSVPVGELLNSAIAALGPALVAAMVTYVSAAALPNASTPAITAAATALGTSVTSAVNAFNTAAQAALSTTVRVK